MNNREKLVGQSLFLNLFKGVGLLLMAVILVALIAACSAAGEETPEAQAPVEENVLEDADPTAEQVETPAGETAEPPEPTAVATTAVDADATVVPDGPQQTVDYPAGALIDVSMSGQVGVLLDEFPEALRDEVAADLLQQAPDFWLERARRQMQMTRNRLNFRNFKYADKGQLPLPPQELWSFTLDEAGAQRQTIQGHDLVMIGYSFATTLLTDEDSPGEAEPALAEEGGVWQEPFVFPADPELLQQRTGNACVNEGGYPPNSFDSQNIYVFYDFACTADSTGAGGCHRTTRPQLSCREALEARVGEVETAIRFERLPYDEAAADAVRVGTLTSEDAPDLLAINEDLDTNYISYRFIEPDDCNLEENAVGDSGWRRLLQFSATVHNTGAEVLEIGPVVSEDDHHVFQYNTCHAHFHYSNYGDFILDGLEQAQASKQAFCVQSTSRYSNNELSPLTHDYSCEVQGIQAGWVDEYVAGLDVQWMDITDVALPEEGQTAELAFVSNETQFLCEGEPVRDESGEVVWLDSSFLTDDGHTIQYPQCDFIPDWDVNNRAATEVFIPRQGSFVTDVCDHGQIGPLRDCGFEEIALQDAVCTPGETVQLPLSLAETADAAVLRVCEVSAALGVGTACAFDDALANRTINQDTGTISFECPVIRDSEDFAGGYSLYSAAVWPADVPGAVQIIEGQ